MPRSLLEAEGKKRTPPLPAPHLLPGPPDQSAGVFSGPAPISAPSRAASSGAGPGRGSTGPRASRPVPGTAASQRLVLTPLPTADLPKHGAGGHSSPFETGLHRRNESSHVARRLGEGRLRFVPPRPHRSPPGLRHQVHRLSESGEGLSSSTSLFLREVTLPSTSPSCPSTPACLLHSQRGAWHLRGDGGWGCVTARPWKWARASQEGHGSLEDALCPGWHCGPPKFRSWVLTPGTSARGLTWREGLYRGNRVKDGS